ncbi:MAG: hypothetical protein GX535_07650 [Xanthomonadaceae bacterium]|nr:hypothetical protein [Xanthomonadaceae bacterium]
MRSTLFFAAPAALLLLCACNQQPNSPPAAQTAAPVPTAPTESAIEEETMPPFVGRIWLSITASDPRGTIVVFLPDKSMLRDSCFETYRVAEWGIISDTRIRWREGTIPIEAEFSQPTPDELILKPVGTSKQQNYVAISVPYVCPSMPR